MERIIQMQKYIEAIRSSSELSLTENEALLSFLHEEEPRRIKAEYDKAVLIEQARSYKKEIDQQRRHLRNVILALIACIWVAGIILYSLVSMAGEVDRMATLKNIQIAEEAGRTADAEDRVSNVIDAWNNTARELQECKEKHNES